MKLLGKYKNGNCLVSIFDDGTKTRFTPDDEYKPEYPESMDLKITNFCAQGCPFCHENSSTEGKHGDIMNLKFIDTLQPYTEIAIGGGDPLSHPFLELFLRKLKSKLIIPSITVHEDRFLKSYDLLKRLKDEKLLYGLGVSLQSFDDEVIEKIRGFKDSVIHVINGVVEMEDLRKLYDKNLKVLILGYKIFRRGRAFYSSDVKRRMQEMFDELPETVKHLEVTSFDNLALTQLDVKRLTKSEEEWKEIFMGDDGKFTMFIDAVDLEYAKSSTSIARYNVRDDIVSMFRKVSEEK